jgi:hypothetical protein
MCSDNETVKKGRRGDSDSDDNGGKACNGTCVWLRMGLVLR